MSAPRDDLKPAAPGPARRPAPARAVAVGGVSPDSRTAHAHAAAPDRDGAKPATPDRTGPVAGRARLTPRNRPPRPSHEPT